MNEEIVAFRKLSAQMKHLESQWAALGRRCSRLERALFVLSTMDDAEAMREMARKELLADAKQR